eukprot:c19120_g1_i5.p1 GENE.c19120_g1_i5~~c19120_g1_i5.p1  ORF type:complete len:812 (+),score=155.99 c19120_g1_i5:3-2438(+)
MGGGVSDLGMRTKSSTHIRGKKEIKSELKRIYEDPRPDLVDCMFGLSTTAIPKKVAIRVLDEFIPRKDARRFAKWLIGASTKLKIEPNASRPKRRTKKKSKRDESSSSSSSSDSNNSDDETKPPSPKQSKRSSSPKPPPARKVVEEIVVPKPPSVTEHWLTNKLEKNFETRSARSCIWCVGRLADGHVFGAGEGQRIMFWNPARPTRDPVFSLDGHSARINAVIVLSSNRIVSAGSDGAVVIHDTSSKQTASVLTGHTRDVWALVALRHPAMPNHVASGSHDSSIRIWDMTGSGNCVAEWRAHQGTVYDLAVMGKHLVSVGGDHMICVWDPLTKKQVTCVASDSGGEFCVTVATLASGPSVVTGSGPSELRVWDLKNRRCSRVLRGHLDRVWSVEGYHGAVLSGSRDGTLRIWDVESGTCVHMINAHPSTVTSVLGVPGVGVITGGRDGSVRMWQEVAAHTKAEDKAQTTSAGRVVVSVGQNGERKCIASTPNPIPIRERLGPKATQLPVMLRTNLPNPIVYQPPILSHALNLSVGFNAAPFNYSQLQQQQHQHQQHQSRSRWDQQSVRWTRTNPTPTPTQTTTTAVNNDSSHSRTFDQIQQREDRDDSPLVHREPDAGVKLLEEMFGNIPGSAASLRAKETARDEGEDVEMAESPPPDTALDTNKADNENEGVGRVGDCRPVNENDLGMFLLFLFCERRKRYAWRMAPLLVVEIIYLCLNLTELDFEPDHENDGGQAEVLHPSKFDSGKSFRTFAASIAIHLRCSFLVFVFCVLPPLVRICSNHNSCVTWTPFNSASPMKYNAAKPRSRR